MLPRHLPLASLLAAILSISLLAPPASAADDPQPGNFRGLGFDQCLAPSQRAMNKWLNFSPYQAVGIYISGKSRYCRDQPNLTPTWVGKQIQNGWRLLPITLGPQASCSDRYPRWGDDPTINPNPTSNYYQARLQGWREAGNAISVAKALGIDPKSTLWYDLEGFDHTQWRCRVSALAFLSNWTRRLHRSGYVSGVYSSAGSGIVALDDERRSPSRAGWTLPDRIWIARWDGKANLRTTYIPDDGWMPGNRMKQFLGGHDETYAGVRINIDSNWIVLGNATRPRNEVAFCGGVNLDFPAYLTLHPGTKLAGRVKAMQCLLQLRRIYTGPIDGVFDRDVVRATNAYRARRGLSPSNAWRRSDWVSLISHGRTATLKRHSTDPVVRRIQRTMNAALDARLTINGWFDAPTSRAVQQYQRRVGLYPSSYITPTIWPHLFRGAR